MATISTEEQSAIKDSFHRLLSDRCTEADVRRVMAEPRGYDPELWKQMAEMGLTALLLPEAFGGIGAGPVELELVMEEAGAALLSSPFLASSVLAVGLLIHSTDEGARSRLLPGIASGGRFATVALTGDSGLWTREGVSVTGTAKGDSWKLDGVASYVLFAGAAKVLLVAANTPDGISAFEVDPTAGGVSITPLECWDKTLRIARVAFDGVAASKIAGVDWETVEKSLDLARIALAGEQAGGARRVFDLTVEYIRTRVQFGRPIGGFQAIKHMAADLLVEVESATSAARYAARSLSDGAPDVAVAINLAAFACADAYSQVAATSIQMHGGIAFTNEYPAHLFLRRARADAQMFGSPAFYRERYIAAQEDAT